MAGPTPKRPAPNSYVKTLPPQLLCLPELRLLRKPLCRLCLHMPHTVLWSPLGQHRPPQNSGGHQSVKPIKMMNGHALPQWCCLEGFLTLGGNIGLEGKRILRPGPCDGCPGVSRRCPRSSAAKNRAQKDDFCQHTFPRLL